jgi:peptide/nickel transport system substrate-binding protein
VSTPRFSAAPTPTRRAMLQMLATSAGVALLAACGVAPSAPSAPAAKPTQPPAAPAAPVATTVPAAASKPTAAAAAPPAATTAATPTAASAPQTAAKPRAGGVLQIGLSGDVASIDGHHRTSGAQESVWLAYERLIQYDDKLKPQPMLAESWDLSSDFKQIKFNLRKGVQFHDGRELTSDDVKWSVLRVRDPKTAAGILLQFSNWFSTIETPDKYTIVFTSEQPRPTIFDVWEVFNVLDKNTMEGPDAKSKINGTGPFAMTEWLPGDHMTFAKHKNYWESGKPYLDGLQVKINKGEQPSLLQVEAGVLDAMRIQSVQDVARLKTDPKYTAWLHPNPGSFWEAGLNVTYPPLDNKSVRQAMSWAFDRKRFAEQIFLGTITPGALPWQSSAPAFDPVKAGSIGFDLEKSRALLRDAGINAFELDALIPAGVYPLMETMLQVYQADLAKLNIKLNIKPVDQAAAFAAINGGTYNGIYTVADVGANQSPATLFNVSPGWKPDLPNNSNWSHPEWKDIVTQLSTETDPTRQQALYARANDFVLDQSWILPLASNPIILLTRSAVNGVTPTMHQGFYFTNAWLGA